MLAVLRQELAAAKSQLEVMLEERNRSRRKLKNSKAICKHKCNTVWQRETLRKSPTPKHDN